MKFRCRYCTQKLAVLDDLIGVEFDCPVCGKTIAVPPLTDPCVISTESPGTPEHINPQASTIVEEPISPPEEQAIPASDQLHVLSEPSSVPTEENSSPSVAATQMIFDPIPPAASSRSQPTPPMKTEKRAPVIAPVSSTASINRAYPAHSHPPPQGTAPVNQPNTATTQTPENTNNKKKSGLFDKWFNKNN